jgi:tRNA(adenine34) deaminase
VLTRDGTVLGRGYNCPIAAHDPTAHAEIIALREAATREANYRLPGTVLYVTLEPCLMCIGAMVHARVERLIFGAADPKVGAVALAGELAARHALNHRLQVTGGVELAACEEILRAYFKERRG